jgi:hypothetical protein
LVEYVPWSHFTPVHATSTATTTRYSAKVAFDVSGKPHKQSVMLPSTSLDGSTYVTQHTALNDRHLVRGTCETYSWVNVDFIQNGISVYQTKDPVELEVKPQHMTIASPKTTRDGAAALCRTVVSGLRSRWTSSPAAVTAEVSLPSDEEIHLVDNKNPTTNKTYTSVELPLHVAFSGLSAPVVEAISQSGGVRCDVETKWYSTRSFNTSAQASAGHTEPNRTVIASQLISTQGSEVIFPPLVRPSDGAGAEEKLSTMGLLHLVLPKSASLPSVQTDLLKVEYELELKYTFQLDGYKSPLFLKGKAKVDCCLSP